MKWNCPTVSLRLLMPPNNGVGINVANWSEYVYSEKKSVSFYFWRAVLHTRPQILSSYKETP